MRTSGDFQALLAIGRYADALIAIDKLRMHRDLFTREKIVSAELLTLTRTAPVGTEVVVRIDQPMAAAAERVERALIKRARAVREGNGVEAAKMLGLSRKRLYLVRLRLGLG